MKQIEKEDLKFRRSFPLPYANTEIWCFELDSLSVHTDIMVRKFLQELPAICRPSAPSLVFINLSETLVTKDSADIIISRLLSIGRLKKVAFVGLNVVMRTYLGARLNKHDGLFAYGFFADLEQAKIWLVSKGIT